MGNSLFDIVTKHARSVATAGEQFHKARLAAKDSKQFIKSSEINDERRTNQMAKRGPHGKTQAASLRRNAQTGILDFFKQIAILQAELKAQTQRAAINREVIKQAESLRTKVGTKKYQAEVEDLNKKVGKNRDDLRRLSNLDKQKEFIIANSKGKPWLETTIALAALEERKAAIFGNSDAKRQALAEAVAADRVLKAVGEGPGSVKPKDLKRTLRNLSDEAEKDSQKVIVRLEAIGIRIRDLNRKALQDPEIHLAERPAMSSNEFQNYLRDSGPAVLKGPLTFEGYQKLVADYNEKYAFDPTRKVVATKEEFDSLKAHRDGAQKISISDIELKCGFTIPRKEGEASQPIRNALRDTKFLDHLDKREQEAIGRGGRAGFNLPALKAEVQKWNSAHPDYQVRIDGESQQDFGKFAKTNQDEIRYAQSQDSDHQESVELILDRGQRMRCRAEVNAENKDFKTQVTRLAKMEKIDVDMTVANLEGEKIASDSTSRGYASWIFEGIARPFIAVGDATGLNEAVWGKRFGLGEIDKKMEEAYTMRKEASEAFERGDIKGLETATKKKDDISAAVSETIASSNGAHGVVGNTVKVVGISGLALASGGSSLTFTGGLLTATVTGMVTNTALTAVDDATDNQEGLNANYLATVGEGGLIGFTSFASMGATNALVNKVGGMFAKGNGAAVASTGPVRALPASNVSALPASTSGAGTTTAQTGTAIVRYEQAAIVPSQVSSQGGSTLLASQGTTAVSSASQNTTINPLLGSLVVRPASDAAVSYGFQYSQTLAETGDFGLAHSNASMAATYAFALHSPKILPIAGRGTVKGFNLVNGWRSNRAASRLNNLVDDSPINIVPEPKALPPRIGAKSPDPEVTQKPKVDEPAPTTTPNAEKKVNRQEIETDVAHLGGGRHGVNAASRLLAGGAEGQKFLMDELARTRKNPLSVESRMVWRNTMDALRSGDVDLTPELALFLRNHRRSFTGRFSLQTKRELGGIAGSANVKVDLNTDPTLLKKLLKTKEYGEGVARQLINAGDEGVGLVLDVAARNRRLGFRIPLSERLPLLRALSEVEFELLPSKMKSHYVRCALRAGKEAMERGNRGIRGELSEVLAEMASRGNPEAQARIIRGASKLLGDKKYGKEFAEHIGVRCGEGAVTEFTRLLSKGRDKRVRLNAAHGLGAFAEKGREIPVKTIQELIKHTSVIREPGIRIRGGIRRECNDVLGKIEKIAWDGNVNSKEFKVIQSWLGDKNLSDAAVKTLLDGDPNTVIPKLAKGLSAPFMSPSKRVAYLSYFEGVVAKHGPDIIPANVASKIDALRVGINPLRNSEVRQGAGRVFAQSGRVIKEGDLPDER